MHVHVRAQLIPILKLPPALSTLSRCLSMSHHVFPDLFQIPHRFPCIASAVIKDPSSSVLPFPNTFRFLVKPHKFQFLPRCRVHLTFTPIPIPIPIPLLMVSYDQPILVALMLSLQMCFERMFPSEAFMAISAHKRPLHRSLSAVLVLDMLPQRGRIGKFHSTESARFFLLRGVRPEVDSQIVPFSKYFLANSTFCLFAIPRGPSNESDRSNG